MPLANARTLPNPRPARMRLKAVFLLLALAGTLTPTLPVSAAEGAPPLMLAKAYRAGLVVPDYWVSEKFDGVRGYWDGEQLLTRSGQRIAAPIWFTANWPKVALDGELWAGRGQFAHAVSAIRQQTPIDAAWRDMRFMVFDVPAQAGTFDDRLPLLQGLVREINQPWVQTVAQTRLANPAALQTMLAATIRLGGEGLMLHRGAAPHQAWRSDDLLKFKTSEDSEARVIGHLAGKGKHAGKLGALLVEMPGVDGQPARRFKLGSGLTDAQRENPPPLGTMVTFRYRGLTDTGIPRFANFMRVAADQPV